MLYIVGIWVILIIGIAGNLIAEIEYRKEMEAYAEDYE